MPRLALSFQTPVLLLFSTCFAALFHKIGTHHLSTFLLATAPYLLEQLFSPLQRDVTSSYSISNGGVNPILGPIAIGSGHAATLQSLVGKSTGLFPTKQPTFVRK